MFGSLDQNQQSRKTAKALIFMMGFSFFVASGFMLTFPELVMDFAGIDEDLLYPLAYAFLAIAFTDMCIALFFFRTKDRK